MEKLGINPVLILVQVINFGLLLFLLKKVLYKPVISAIKAREEKLESIEKEKEKLNAETEAQDAKTKTLLASAQKEKKEVLANTRREAEEEKRKIIEAANITAKNTLKDADRQVEALRKKLEKDFEIRAVAVASAMVKKVLSESLDQRAKGNAVDKAIKNLGKVKIS